MSEFVDECRREWKRLGVPDPVANEMAADLSADLDEAEAEGGSAEDVLGNSAFDPRRFAAAWAVARGVTGPPPADPRPFWRPPIAIALTGCLAVLAVLAGFALLVGRGSSSIAIATRHIVAGPGPARLFIPGPGRFGPGPFGVTQFDGAHIHPIAMLLLLVGILGIGLLVVTYWFGWFGARRRRESRRSPGWN